MLSEWQRRAYLQAMGVACYMPRLLLPGAKPSLQCEMPALPAVDVAPVSVPADEGLSQAAAVSASSAHHHQLLKTMDLSRRQSAASEPVAARTAVVASAQIPRFALTVARAGRLLIVDEAPTGDKNPDDYLQLLQNLLFALGIGSESLAVDTFVWPMTRLRNAHVDQSATAARQALQAYVNKQLMQSRFLLIMGDTSQRYLLAPDSPKGVLHDYPDGVVPCLYTASASRALDEPALKAVIWRDVLPLLTALRSH